MTVEEDTGPTRKGRSNAILTYETVESIQLGLVKVDGKLDHLAARLGEMKDLHVDHEVRIRALELAQAVVTAATTSSKSVWLWVWGAAIALPGTITAVVSLIRIIGGS